MKPLTILCVLTLALALGGCRTFTDDDTEITQIVVQYNGGVPHVLDKDGDWVPTTEHNLELRKAEGVEILILNPGGGA